MTALTSILAAAALAALPTGESLYQQGLAAAAGGDRVGAAALFERSVDEDPDGPYAPAALSEWAGVLEGQGDLEGADALYARLEQTYPSHRLARAAASRRRAIDEQLSMSRVEARYRELIRGYAGRDPAEVVADVEALVEEHPDHPVAAEAGCWLGAHCWHMRDPERALAHYRRSLEVDPRSPCAAGALEDIGTIEVSLGRYDEAEAAFAAMAELGGHAVADSRRNLDELGALRRQQERRRLARGLGTAGGVAAVGVVTLVWMWRRLGSRP